MQFSQPEITLSNVLLEQQLRQPKTVAELCHLVPEIAEVSLRQQLGMPESASDEDVLSQLRRLSAQKLSELLEVDIFVIYQLKQASSGMIVRVGQ